MRHWLKLSERIRSTRTQGRNTRRGIAPPNFRDSVSAWHTRSPRRTRPAGHTLEFQRAAKTAIVKGNRLRYERVAPGGAGWGIPARRAGAISSHVLLAPRTGGETRRQDPRARCVRVLRRPRRGPRTRAAPAASRPPFLPPAPADRPCRSRS